MGENKASSDSHTADIVSNFKSPYATSHRGCYWTA